MSIGTVLARLRKARGLTQEALARRAGCNRQALTEVERGTARGSDAFLRKVVAALHAHESLATAEVWLLANGRVASILPDGVADPDDLPPEPATDEPDRSGPEPGEGEDEDEPDEAARVVGTCHKASCQGDLVPVLSDEDASVWVGTRCEDCGGERPLRQPRPASEIPAAVEAHRAGRAA